jgi:hypothetical protein
MAAPSFGSTAKVTATGQRMGALSLEQQVALLKSDVERLSAKVAVLEQQCVRQSATGVVTLPAPHKLDLGVGSIHVTMEGTCLSLVSPMTVKINATELQINTAKVSAAGQTASFAGAVVCNVLQANSVKPAAGNVW